MKQGSVNWGIGVIDVRDLAEAHFRAGFTPEANGRNIISAHDSNMADLAKPLIAAYGKQFPFPKSTLPKWMVWLLGPIANKAMTRKMVSNNVNYSWHADNSKAKRELGLSYRTMEESMTEFFQQLIDANLLKPSK